MTKTLHRVEVFDGKGVVVTLPTLKGPAEAARFIEGAVEAAGPRHGRAIRPSRCDARRVRRASA